MESKAQKKKKKTQITDLIVGGFDTYVVVIGCRASSPSNADDLSGEKNRNGPIVIGLDPINKATNSTIFPLLS